MLCQYQLAYHLTRLGLMAQWLAFMDQSKGTLAKRYPCLNILIGLD
jgi:hypothetical protein